MTEQEWLTSDDPAAMLKWSFGYVNVQSDYRRNVRISKRKLRLFATAIEPMLGGPSYDEVDYWYEELQVFLQPEITLAIPEPVIQAALLREVVGNPLQPWMREDDFVAGKPLPGDRLHLVHSSWLTADVLNTATDIYEGRTFDELPVLADALEDAGCVGEMVACPLCSGKDYYEPGDRMSTMYPSQCPTCHRYPYQKDGGKVSVPHPLLAHLRSPGPHVRGCWAVDLILGKE